MQLYETPWLKNNWNLHDLYFEQNGKDNEIYVTETFDSKGSPEQNENPGRWNWLLVKNDTLFALGVALLELSNGQVLSDCQIKEDLNEKGEEDKMTRFNTVNRLLRDLNDGEPSSRFTSAVNWCFFPLLGVDGPKASEDDYDFSNNRFRKYFWQYVMIPLQEDYEAVHSGVPKATYR